VIALLGGFRGSTAIGFVVLFAAAAIALAILLTKRRFTPETAMAASMFSVGGLAMLAGWWADAGFGPIVRDGVCLCNCATSTMGLGLFARMTWMDAGMLAASLPALVLPANSSLARVGCWVAGILGMILGMEVTVWLMALLPPTHPQATFFATYAAMAAGMMIGMTAACGVWRKTLGRP
jgi:hypothetical protein